MLYSNRREYRSPESEEENEELKNQQAQKKAQWDPNISSKFGEKLQYVASDLSTLEALHQYIPQEELDNRISMLHAKAENMHIKKQLEEKDQQVQFLMEESKSLQQSIKNIEDKYIKAANSGSSPALTITDAIDTQQKEIDTHLTHFPCHEPHARFVKHAQELGKVASVPVPKGKIFQLNDTMEVINHMEKVYGTDYVLRAFYNNDNSLRQQAKRILRTTNHAR